MAEVLPSSFRLQQTETADSKFSKTLVANLFKDTLFKPGITFTNKYTENAGQIYARRLGKPTVLVKDATAANGMKFTHAQTADSLVMIPRRDNVNVSEECYEMVDRLRSSGQSIQKVEEVVAAWNEKCQMQYMSYLLKAPATAGQVEVGGCTLTADSGGSAITDIDGLIESLLATREQIIVNGGKANVILLSPEMETVLLSNVLKAGNAYVPNTNEEWLRSGQVGRLYGIPVFVTNLLGAGTPLQIPVAGNALPNVGNAALCDYIMYDYDTFAIAADLWAPRIVEAEGFIGTYAQCQSIVGGGVVNPALAYAKVNAAPVTP